MHNIFSIKNLGKLHFFLGIEVAYLQEKIVLTQLKFTKELLKQSGIQNFKRTITPFSTNLKLFALEGTLLPKLSNHHEARSFLYNTNSSQFMQTPTDSHWNALMHTMQYVHATCGQGIALMGADKLTLQAFCDSDWGAYVDSRRSVTGYMLSIADSLPISLYIYSSFL